MGSHAFVVYASQWGNVRKYASALARSVAAKYKLDVSQDNEVSTTYTYEGRKVLTVCSLVDIQAWLHDVLEQDNDVLLDIFVGTNQGGAFPDDCAKVVDELRTWAWDHREEHSKKDKVSYLITGFGDSAYGRELFCAPAVELNRILKQLGLSRPQRVQKVDADMAALESPAYLFRRQMVEQFVGKAVARASAAVLMSDSEEEIDESDISDASEVELENIGDCCSTMISKNQRKVLEKQGYKLIGSHSAVKLCRWTKHQLRGNGGCYKHTFYGIQSHRCMETTCSLACANKCVFCWRHHKNPVGTSWKWQMDEPEVIIEGAVTHQYNMIKALRGVPGVADSGRLPEGLEVAHCALSLVGEPIMYPRINDLLTGLHRRKISTFLVTNAQFPEQIEQLIPCTQLYVSIDAATQATMKAVDRPLFSDFWDRFKHSLENIKGRPDRTVYRLTLIKEQNMKDLEEYAKLVTLGHPHFIELKGVTFTGPSGHVRMEDIPVHAEIVNFGFDLARHLKSLKKEFPDLPDYEVALEHEHSCSVLLAQTKYRNEKGKWRTWIDFEKFFELCADPSNRDFDALDYSIESPDWAHYGAEEKGFDPQEARKFRSKNKRPELSEVSGGGCTDNCDCACKQTDV